MNTQPNKTAEAILMEETDSFEENTRLKSDVLQAMERYAQQFQSTPTNIDAGKVFEEIRNILNKQLKVINDFSGDNIPVLSVGGIQESAKELTTLFNQYCNQQPVSENNSSELIGAYREYVKVLGDEINDLVGLAIVHGWESRNVERGISCRDKINKLESAIPTHPVPVSSDKEDEVARKIIYQLNDFSKDVDIKFYGLPIERNLAMRAMCEIVKNNIQELIGKK